MFATGGLRYWKDGRDVPDVMLGMYDYPETKQYPAFNLALRVNFVNGVGREFRVPLRRQRGQMFVGNSVKLAKQPRETEPGLHDRDILQSHAGEVSEGISQEVSGADAPNADAMRPKAEEEYLAAARVQRRIWIITATSSNAVRSRKPVVEDATFGLRAAGPALLSNLSYFEKRWSTGIRSDER